MEKVNIVENPTPDNYRDMWEKGLKVFDKVVVQLGYVEAKAEKLEQLITTLSKDNFDLSAENEHFRRVLADNGIEVWG